MSTLSQIAYSGMNAAQTALNSTSQNVANVNTPGFSRLQTLVSSLSGSSRLSAGGGVQVASIRRIADGFQNQQLWRATTEQSYHNGAQQYLTALEQLMASDGSSISTGLDQFFASLSEASATPDSNALRQQVLSEAGNLARRFNGLDSNIESQLSALREQRQAVVTEIGGLSGNIAQLNQRITQTESSHGDTTALRDQRDELVRQLSQHVSIRVNEVEDGSLSVSLDNGQPLVAGPTAGQLSIELDDDGEQRIALAFAGTSFPLRQDRFGGTLGGLYDSEKGSLEPTRDALREIAGQLAQQVNDTLAGGYDLNGDPGQALFQFNAGSSSALLSLNPLSADQLAFSGAAGEPGNNQQLLALLDLRERNIDINGLQTTFNDAYAGLLGQVASDSRQSQADLDTATAVTEQAQAQRDSTSAVNLDEEAVNLMTYQQAYQANMRVISTARDLFDTMLAAF